jgi:hypothetical protein
MGERKVLNKYIPADFDPSLVPKGKKLSAKDGTVPVRMMLPFSVQCSTCNTFLYQGRKFNSKKEKMGGADGVYLGITRWRFYIKCTSCARTLTFLTDPQNADYEMESGGTRNYELKKDKQATEDEVAAQLEKEEEEDPMRALENRVLESQREVADLDNLEDIRAMNARHIAIISGSNDFYGGAQAVLAAVQEKQQLQRTTVSDDKDLLTNEDEELVKSIQFGQNAKIHRLDEKDEEQLESERRRQAELLEASHKAFTQQASKQKLVVVKKRKRITAACEEKPNIEPITGLAGLLGGYGSDSD